MAGAIGGGAVLAGCKPDSSSTTQPSGTGASASGNTPVAAPSVAASQPEMARFPEKTDLILLTDRPPQLETPIKYFETDLTPNEAFFVRWHLADIPTSVDPAQFRLAVRGHVNNAFNLSVDELKSGFEAVSIVAVNQCSGNSRSLFEPRVAGGQWGHGAMGNAKWTGVRLADLLDKAGVKSGAVDVSFQGLDRPVLPVTPAFIKSLKLEKAKDRDVIVAYAMNDQPLPMLNGFPIRLVVPGWYATYWVKALNDINVLNEPFQGFWMAKAYRIADNPHATETPDQLAAVTVPINRMTVRSLIVSPRADTAVSAGKACEIQGIAFDGGKGIAEVEISTDGGGKWKNAALDASNMDNFSWRRWRFNWTPTAPGTARLMARATNAAGDTQETSQWNRSGYARDVIEQVEINVG
jgi:DMSO/TMAO reductase YedYZ molybdopterin-dependent catalytic subunit